MMNVPNLNLLMVSISKLKQELSEIILKKETKVVVKNNEPVSVIMPYSDYLNLEDTQKRLHGVGEDITLKNGVQIKVVVEPGILNFTDINVYVKMKTSGEYQLYTTNAIGIIPIEKTLTPDEIVKCYKGE